MQKLLKLLLIAAFFNCLAWIILIPIWQYPDEQAHFAQVQDIAEFGYRPTDGFDTSYEIELSEEILGTERDAFGNNKFTYHPEYRIEYANGVYGPREYELLNLPLSARTQLVKKEATLNPPFYYFLGSLAYKFFYDGSLFTRVYAVRLMSALIFLGTILIAFKIGKLIFEEIKILPVVLATLVAFKPMLVFSSTGVLPDTLTNFLFSMVLFLSLKIVKNGLKLPTLILIALTLVFGVLTRQQFSISILIVFIAILYQIYKNPKYLRHLILAISALSLFIYLSNTLLITFPFFTDFRVPEIFDRGFLNFSFEKPLISTFTSFFIWTLKHSIAEVWPWYWGVYRWLSLTLPAIYYQVINRIIILSFLGIIAWLVLTIKQKKFAQKVVYFSFLILSPVVYFLVVIIWDYFFYVRRGFSFGIQGRYFFPLVIAHLAMILVGLNQIFKIVLKDYAKIGIFLLAVLIIIFNNLSLSFVAASYYDISSFTNFIVQASQYKPVLFKGNTILLIILANFILQALMLFKFAKEIIKSNESN